jgi:hypothetical protein
MISYAAISLSSRPKPTATALATLESPTGTGRINWGWK